MRRGATLPQVVGACMPRASPCGRLVLQAEFGSDPFDPGEDQSADPHHTMQVLLNIAADTQNHGKLKGKQHELLSVLSDINEKNGAKVLKESEAIRKTHHSLVSIMYSLPLLSQRVLWWTLTSDGRVSISGPCGWRSGQELRDGAASLRPG